MKLSVVHAVLRVDGNLMQSHCERTSPDLECKNSYLLSQSSNINGSSLRSPFPGQQPGLLLRRLKTGGDWALRFPAPEGVKFNVVVRGACLLATDGMEEPIRLEAGDCFLVSCRSPLLVGSDLSLPAADATLLYRDAPDGVAHYGKARIVS